MKRKILLTVSLTCLLLAWNLNISSQTITQAINLRSYCCFPGDSIDIGNDGQYDIRIYSQTGIDSRAYFNVPMQTNFQVTSAIDSGASFLFYYDYTTIANTTLGCYWDMWWQPGGGIRYSGFKRINAPNDTTYGWIKLDFLGTQGTCADTIASYEIAYNTVPNLPLSAGQKLNSTGLGHFKFENNISLYPNPFSNQLTFSLADKEQTTISLYNFLGQQVLQQTFINSTTINTEQLPDGIYFYELPSGKGTLKTGKLVKQ